MSEMKLDIELVHASLNELKSTIESLENSFSKHTTGSSSLEVVDKLKQMKKQLESISMSYQTVLREHTESANLVVERLQETDRTIASSYPLLK
ncbi:hypothetical protein BTS2_0407 [Bacillus sp. TS-2]|nr:hypothetical protein BTS2_0407 [Bacillus sp. TS-2]